MTQLFNIRVHCISYFRFNQTPLQLIIVILTLYKRIVFWLRLYRNFIWIQNFVLVGYSCGKPLRQQWLDEFNLLLLTNLLVHAWQLIYVLLTRWLESMIYLLCGLVLSRGLVELIQIDRWLFLIWSVISKLKELC